MTTSSTVTAASNGGDTPTDNKPAAREHGLARLREEECYYLTGLIEECLDEARHLVKKVNNKAYNRISDHDGSKGTKPLDRGEMAATLHEAYDCASHALAYLFNASTHLRVDDVESVLADDIEPAF